MDIVHTRIVAELVLLLWEGADGRELSQKAGSVILEILTRVWTMAGLWIRRFFTVWNTST